MANADYAVKLLLAGYFWTGNCLNNNNSVTVADRPTLFL